MSSFNLKVLNIVFVCLTVSIDDDDDDNNNEEDNNNDDESQSQHSTVVLLLAAAREGAIVVAMLPYARRNATLRIIVVRLPFRSIGRVGNDD